MALLQMINAVRGKLREERIDLISADDQLTEEIIGLLNDAGSAVLEGNDWDFDIHHDGRLFYPTSQSGTYLGFVAQKLPLNASAARLFYSADAGSGEVFEDDDAIDLAGFRCSGNRARARLLVTDSSKPNTSWIITSIGKGAAQLDVTISGNFFVDGVGDSAAVFAWETYVNEVVLPSTVKDVLSVRNEEEPVRLEFVEREMQFDQWVPRTTDSRGDRPEVVMVGGTITSTARTSSTAWDSISNANAVTGIGCTIWPIPNADVHLGYSYRVQHADLSLATDEWPGVPNDIIHAIEWLAYQFALDSGMQNDPEAAKRAERQVEKRIARALNKQSRQPNRRRIPRAFGDRPHGDLRRRWASQTISAP